MNSRVHNHRIVEPELLDALPASDPDAIRSRRDLRLINALMGNKRWILTQIRKLGSISPQWENWELGAGDGTLGASIADRFGYDSIRLTALDLAPRAPTWPAAWDWRQADILSAAREAPPSDIVLANLILHHFKDDELELVGRWISKARAIIAVEPTRARFPHALAYAMRLLGINHVTRADIHTSIRAGFAGSELPDLLGLDPSTWDIRISNTALGAHRMIARRRATSP